MPILQRAFAWFFNRPYLLLALTFLFWAINLVLGRFIAGQIPPVALAQIRWIGASAIILPLAWPHLKRDWPAIRGSLPVMLLLAASGIAAYNTLAYYGLQYTEAINGLLMQSIAPLVIGVWSLILFRDRMTPNQILGVMLSLLGVVLIICRGDPLVILHLKLNIGDVIMLVAISCYGFYSALLKKRPKVHYLSMLGFTIPAGALMIVPFFLLEMSGGRFIQPTPLTFAVVGYVVFIPSVLAYMFFNRGVELIGPNRAGPFFHLLPVFGSAIAIIFLGEHPRWYHGVGYALILGGIGLAQLRFGRARRA
ncbi:DMT family transporter [Kaistia dalseonensis]|uniref:Drug/metabolite transporter (DMT)-like permease n=1 Tax=Kaistia dalseonensis TaxID=410840 RepID=A0ABU0HAZ0_9HYPH|nr:DMT family transporter [Kaistia dalseonensis]MCX5496530.1 DMT family transporter [Kaistia dalseonensis]MDQ0439152.1 drug/metabolite transporter (DMT)-like permease [Kaistia dalseonensis]